MNNDIIREVFEEKVFLNFVSTAHGLRRKPTGEYVSEMLEDHWNTFQEGWEYAIEYVKKKERGAKYSDIISDGGMDPRYSDPNKWDGSCSVCGISGVNGYVCNNLKCPTKVTC